MSTEVESETTTPGSQENSSTGPEQVADEMIDLNMFAGLKKKKKKKKKKKTEPSESTQATPDQANESSKTNKNEPTESVSTDSSNSTQDQPSLGLTYVPDDQRPWANDPDRDYTYDELCDRIFSMLHEFNPQLRGERKAFIMAPPELERRGRHNVVILNFGKILKALNRPEEHVVQYILAELACEGSVDSNKQLILKSRFREHVIEQTLRSYIQSFVQCHMCGSHNTVLTKKYRIPFVECSSCCARRAVAAVNKGYQALARGARRALR